MAWKFRKEIIGGLDIGSHSIKYAAVESGSDRILELWQRPLMPERRARDERLQGEALHQRLKALVDACKSECLSFVPNVVTKIQSEVTQGHYLEFPNLRDEELKVAIPAETRKYVALPIEKTALTYFMVPPISSEKKRIGVFVITAPRDLVESTQASLEQCGLNILRIETPAISLVREFARNHALRDSHLRFLVHSGFHFTMLVAVRGNYPYFSREISVGGQDFTYAFQMARRIPWQEAEAHNLRYDVNEKDPGIEPFLLQWLDQIKKTIDYFRSRFNGQGQNAHELFLSGGTAQFANLPVRLQDYLGIPVKVDGWNRLKLAKTAAGGKENAPSFKIAVGLALKEL